MGESVRQEVSGPGNLTSDHNVCHWGVSSYFRVWRRDGGTKGKVIVGNLTVPLSRMEARFSFLFSSSFPLIKQRRPGWRGVKTKSGCPWVNQFN